MLLTCNASRSYFDCDQWLSKECLGLQPDHLTFHWLWPKDWQPRTWPHQSPEEADLWPSFDKGVAWQGPGCWSWCEGCCQVGDEFWHKSSEGERNWIWLTGILHIPEKRTWSKSFVKDCKWFYHSNQGYKGLNREAQLKSYNYMHMWHLYHENGDKEKNTIAFQNIGLFLSF